MAFFHDALQIRMRVAIGTSGALVCIEENRQNKNTLRNSVIVHMYELARSAIELWIDKLYRRGNGIG